MTAFHSQLIMQTKFLYCLLAMINFMVIAQEQQEDPQIAKLCAELTSKNREPEIKNDGNGGGKPSVVITREFSWDEQARVRGAISRLAKNPSEELVTQLLAISDSTDYCISTINDNEYIYNKSVGRVARQLAYAIIEIPVHKAFVDVPSKETNPYQSSLELYDVLVTPNTRKLLFEDRLPLYQVQLKFLEANKAALQKKYSNDKVAAEVIKKIDTYHKTISENKKPMLQPIGYPVLEEYFDQYELSRAKITIAPTKK